MLHDTIQHMKIVIATPFYPPETEPMAAYAKKLAETLAKQHDITVVAYARLPEESPGVRIFAVNKRFPLFVRLAIYTITLFRAVRKADILYAENGASVELPSVIVAILTRRPFLIHLGDKTAVSHSAENFFYKKIHSFAKKRAISEITDTPLSRPEILPFGLPPNEELIKYRASWEAHIKKLEEIFNRVT